MEPDLIAISSQKMVPCATFDIQIPGMAFYLRTHNASPTPSEPTITLIRHKLLFSDQQPQLFQLGQETSHVSYAMA